MKAKVLAKFPTNVNEIVVSVGKKSFFWKSQHVVELSDNKDNCTIWLSNFIVKPEVNADGLFLIDRDEIQEEIQRVVGTEAIIDLGGDWNNCKILFIDENNVVDIKKPGAAIPKKRFVASPISANQRFLGDWFPIFNDYCLLIITSF